MSSAFFRKPGEGSSDDSSAEEEEEAPDIDRARHSTENGIEDGIDLATTESLSTTASFSKAKPDDPQPQDVPNADHHRNLMLATLLEDFYKTRAAEILNTADPSANYHRLSPAVQPLAKKLYTEAGHTLASNGFLPAAATSDGLGKIRQQYLAGLDGLSIKALDEKDLDPSTAPGTLPTGAARSTLALVRAERRGSSILNLVQEPMNSIIMQTGRMGISSPHSDMQLTLPHARRSHYEASFQQMKLLGRGGFGRVYHALNLFDRKDYAVKKVPLSHRMSQRYRESGHQELESVLREVQALAELEHSNIVRYHATWIEEPRSSHASPPTSPARHSAPMPIARSQKLLDIKPYKSPDGKSKPLPRPISRDHSDGIVFGYDNTPRRSSRDIEPFTTGWSRSEIPQESTPLRDSEIFTDGQHCPRTGSTDSSIDSSVYVLHVQMSMYPITLAQYLSPVPSNSTSAPGSPLRRHCFHLIPSLRILLGILCGLQYVHVKGLIHRDIKPGNVFLSSLSANDLISEGFYDVGSCSSCPNPSPHHINPRIGDFGLVAELARSASASPHSSPTSSKAVGTEYYRPPAWPDDKGETAHTIDEKLDVFALGVILVEMLWVCGTSSERIHVLKDLQRGRLPKGLKARIESEGHEAGTGAGVERCIKGMIEKDPAQRWSCPQVKECIDGILQSCRPNEDPSMRTLLSLDATEEVG